MAKRYTDGLRFYGADDSSVGGGAGPNAGGIDPAAEASADSGRTFTQTELDKIIGERLKRERKDWESRLETETRKAAMTETARLAGEKDELENRARSLEESANKRAVLSEAKAQAAAMGIKADRLNYLLRLVDLSEVSTGEDGEPDLKAIKSAVEQVAKDFPEILSGSGMSRAGGDFSKANGNETPLSEEIIGRMSNAELRRRLPEIKAFYATR